MRRTFAASILVLAACTGGGGAGSPDPTLDVDGVQVVVASDAPFTRSADFAPRIESTIQVALDYWGGSWDDLRGRTLSFLATGDVGCGQEGALGCFDGDLRVSTQDPEVGTFECLEQTVLVHEIGHAVIGDPDHRDPRWMDLQPVVDRLSGRTGYTPTGPVNPCVLYPSVWRHPLGTP